ncbi:MAG TPA: SRPBCC domain-containing protein [Oculatellaceae cyanobacterium]
MTTKTETSALEVTRTIKADVKRVYKAWTDPELMRQWMGCAESQRVSLTQNFTVGGNYCITVKLADERVVQMFGTFLEIVENEKLVYSWTNNSEEYPASDTIVTIVFTPKGSSTEIVLTHSKFDRPVSVQGHSMGWGTSLERLSALFEQ